jgi:hypothetical protein
MVRLSSISVDQFPEKEVKHHNNNDYQEDLEKGSVCIHAGRVLKIRYIFYYLQPVGIAAR